MHFIGIDGGGTKTSFLCLDPQGQEVFRKEAPTVHPMQTPCFTATEILKDGILDCIHAAHIRLSDIAICFGLAGYGRNADLRAHIELMCQSASCGAPYCIASDAEVALEGAFLGEDGILLIAGTGSMALAKQGDTYRRSGGWGFQLGDEGSAFWIAKRLLNAYTKQCDGRRPRTQLVDAVKTFCDIQDDYDVISYVAQTVKERRYDIACLAPLVSDLAAQGDEDAQQILSDAALNLYQMADALGACKTGLARISYVGGVWESGAYILDPLAKLCEGHYELAAPQKDPAYGACLLAQKRVLP